MSLKLGGGAMSAQRERIREKRTVIDEKLVIDAVVQYRRDHLDESIPELEVEEEVDLENLDVLELTHQRIYRISNLKSYETLTRLTLNSNIIERIEGLDTLVNLQWLDLSFNRIKRMEGLDKLVNLTDLSLFENQISKIEGLGKLQKLQVLSLGNNNVADIKDVTGLRPFSSLRVLNLKGNPVTEKESYAVTVIAFLPQVKYLDYRLLTPTAAQKSYQPGDLADLRKSEKKQAEEAKEAAVKQARSRREETLNISGISTLFDDMMAADKSYHDQIKLFEEIPGFRGEVIMKYESEFRKEAKYYYEASDPLFEEKVAEEKKFLAAKASAYAQSKDESVRAIQAFDAKKRSALTAYSESGDAKALASLKEDLKKLEADLMHIEMLLVERVTDLFDEYNASLRKSKDKSLSLRSDFSMKVGELTVQYRDKLQDFAEREQERIEEDAGSDDELEGDEKPLMRLLKDDDKLKEAIKASYEAQKEYVEDLIARHSKQEEAQTKSKVSRLQLEIYQKNRVRVAETIDVVGLYRKVIEMTEESDDEPEDEDEDAMAA